MTVYDFPELRIERQLFHVPGAGFDGGLTSGGAQLITPEPGGFSMLEIEPALRDGEWTDPAMSWLMSKISGQVFRIRLTKTPQIAWSRERLDRIDPDWANRGGAKNDAVTRFTAATLKGATGVSVDMSEFGRLLRRGHVIGHAYDCYLIDDITYAGTVANITVSPPVRRPIGVNDTCLLTPWFTGRISNGGDIRAAYDNNGHVKLGKIILGEAVL